MPGTARVRSNFHPQSVGLAPGPPTPPRARRDLRPRAASLQPRWGRRPGAAEQPTGSRSDFLTVRNEIPQGDSKGNEAGTLRASPPAALPVSGTRFLNKVGRVRAREGRGLTRALRGEEGAPATGTPPPRPGTPFLCILHSRRPHSRTAWSSGVRQTFPLGFQSSFSLFHPQRALCWFTPFLLPFRPVVRSAGDFLNLLLVS